MGQLLELVGAPQVPDNLLYAAVQGPDQHLVIPSEVPAELVMVQGLHVKSDCLSVKIPTCLQDTPVVP